MNMQFPKPPQGYDAALQEQLTSAIIETLHRDAPAKLPNGMTALHLPGAEALNALAMAIAILLAMHQEVNETTLRQITKELGRNVFETVRRMRGSGLLGELNITRGGRA